MIGFLLEGSVWDAQRIAEILWMSLYYIGLSTVLGTIEYLLTKKSVKWGMVLLLVILVPLYLLDRVLDIPSLIIVIAPLVMFVLAKDEVQNEKASQASETQTE